MKITDSIPRATVSINLRFLEENYKVLRSLIPNDDVKVLCVVKADAYGHGATEVTKRLEFIGAEYFGVASLNEALSLRREGVRSPILVMSGIMPWDSIMPFVNNKLTPVVYDMNCLERIMDESKGFELPLKIHLKFDTGMGRLGFNREDALKIIKKLKNIEHIHIEGLMSHFASSEVRDEYGLKQIEIFKDIVHIFKSHDINPDYIHMANTGAIIVYPEACFNMVRAGIGLYGSYPDSSLMDKVRLKQVMKLSSRIALIRTFPEGYSLSYGRTYKTSGQTRIACVPLGYSDGYPRALSNKGFVLIRGRRCNIVGRICMDWILVDITGHDDLIEGDEVIFMGFSEEDCITADDIARLEGTIPYEVLCRVSRKIKRTYVE